MRLRGSIHDGFEYGSHTYGENGTKRGRIARGGGMLYDEITRTCGGSRTSVFCARLELNQITTMSTMTSAIAMIIDASMLGCNYTGQNEKNKGHSYFSFANIDMIMIARLPHMRSEHWVWMMHWMHSIRIWIMMRCFWQVDNAEPYCYYEDQYEYDSRDC
ncbi:MAG: hypothetical protein WC919_06615 [Candidatus Paceibacterota bacterium]|jgi:hypothetical protein